MNIVLLGHDDIASLFAFASLVNLRPQYRYRLFVSGPLESDALAPPALAELARADRALFDAFRSRPDLPSGLSAGVPLPRPNAPEGLAALRGAAPDLVISIRYRRILREQAIAVPRLGVLNLHSGILPDYQGVMATFWALLAGEPEIGCTLHRIVDAGIDTGPVVGIARSQARPGASYLANLLSLYPAGVRLLAHTVDLLAAGRALPASLQAPGEGRYYTAPDRDALARFDAARLALVDGSESGWLESCGGASKNGEYS
jgi:methionyl-tRNA formyltransferase